MNIKWICLRCKSNHHRIWVEKNAQNDVYLTETPWFSQEKTSGFLSSCEPSSPTSQQKLLFCTTGRSIRRCIGLSYLHRFYFLGWQRVKTCQGKASSILEVAGLQSFHQKFIHFCSAQPVGRRFQNHQPLPSDWRFARLNSDVELLIDTRALVRFTHHTWVKVASGPSKAQRIPYRRGDIPYIYIYICIFIYNHIQSYIIYSM